MDDPERRELTEQMATLREETRILREQMVEHRHVTDFLSAATEMLRNLDHYYRVLFDRYLAHRPDPPPELVPDGPTRQVGKLSHPDWAHYRGFREHLQNLEAETNLKPELVSRELIAGLAGVHPRTLKRHMQAWGVDRIWPPSTWPERAPFEPPQLRLIGDHLAYAAGLGTLAVLDGLSDGRIDSVIRICKMLIGRQHLSL